MKRNSIIVLIFGLFFATACMGTFSVKKDEQVSIKLFDSQSMIGVQQVSGYQFVSVTSPSELAKILNNLNNNPEFVPFITDEDLYNDGNDMYNDGVELVESGDPFLATLGILSAGAGVAIMIIAIFKSEE